MHDRHVAHMVRTLQAQPRRAYLSDASTGRVQDVFDENILLVSRRKQWQSPRLVPRRAYFIDFGCSLRLPLGPGVQPAVELPDTIWERPREGVTRFDPYAWDMLRVGRTFEGYLKVSSFGVPQPCCLLCSRAYGPHSRFACLSSWGRSTLGRGSRRCSLGGWSGRSERAAWGRWGCADAGRVHGWRSGCFV